MKVNVMSDEQTEPVVPEAPAPTPSMVERIEALESGTVASPESVAAANATQDTVTALEEKLANVTAVLNELSERLVSLEADRDAARAAAPAVEVETETLDTGTTE